MYIAISTNLNGIPTVSNAYLVVFLNKCDMVDDPELIEKYKRLHAMGSVWPEVEAGMKAVGIIDMEIYISGSTLFMIMDTVDHFDHESAFAKLAALPKQAEWEATVAEFQKTTSNASADEKWRLMDRIYKLEQEKEYAAIDGQRETVEIRQKKI